MRDLVDIFEDINEGMVLWAEIEEFLPEEVRFPEYVNNPAPVRHVPVEEYLASRRR